MPVIVASRDVVIKVIVAVIFSTCLHAIIYDGAPTKYNNVRR